MATTARPVSHPFLLKTLTVLVKRRGIVDPDDFSDHVSQLQLTPTAGSASWTSGNGKSINRAAVATWAVGLGLVQDLADDSLLRYLLDHEGDQAQLLVTFDAAADPMLLDITLTPAGIGGSADGSIMATSVTLPVDGRPLWSPTAAFTIA